MIVDVWQDPDWGMENLLVVWLRQDFVAPEMELTSFVAAPCSVPFHIEDWNGEHFSFDADDFVWSDEYQLNVCEGVVDAELTETWLHQFGLWEQMKPFQSIQHERSMKELLLEPVRDKMGLERLRTEDELMEFVGLYA